MTPERARTAANVVLVSAGLAAAYVVVTSPPLRRLAWRAGRWWLGTSLPALVAAEVGRAWRASATRVQRPDGSRAT